MGGRGTQRVSRGAYEQAARAPSIAPRAALRRKAAMVVGARNGWLRERARRASLARAAAHDYTDGRLSRRHGVPVAANARINWTNAVTLASVAVLVGTELVGAGAAAGWAIGGLFQLGDLVTHVLEAIFILMALTGLYHFLRAALAHEPIRR
jgi:hypothetical protein